MQPHAPDHDTFALFGRRVEKPREPSEGHAQGAAVVPLDPHGGGIEADGFSGNAHAKPSAGGDAPHEQVGAEDSTLAPKPVTLRDGNLGFEPNLGLRG